MSDAGACTVAGVTRVGLACHWQQQPLLLSRSSVDPHATSTPWLSNTRSAFPTG